MLHIHMNDIDETVERQIVQELIRVGPELRVTLSVPEQYIASSQAELAAGCLITWYIAERLAECASTCTCVFEEGEEGAGEFELRFSVSNPRQMAKRIAQYASAFDPDDDESRPFLYDEASDWLRHQRARKPHFPELEKCYRDDAAGCLPEEDDDE